MTVVAAVLIGGPEDGADVEVPRGRYEVMVAERPDISAVIRAGDEWAMPRTGVYRAEITLGRPSMDDLGRVRMVWRGWQ